MGIKKVSRQLYPVEIALLKKGRSEAEKVIQSKVKYHYYAIALVLGAACAYIASINTNVLVFILGTTAMLCFSFVVFMPYETYKGRKMRRAYIAAIDVVLERNAIIVMPVNAIRIASAAEYDDEGVLYIIEYEPDNILYLWDSEFYIRKFPCLKFEVYEDDFFKLIGRQIYPQSEKIKPITIDKDKKWAYLSNIGAPEHLSTENISFEAKIEQFLS